MVETLYSTSKPEKERSESFVLVLTSRKVNGQRAYAFMQEHGQWSPELNGYVHRVSSIHAEEGTTLGEARELYRTAKAKLAERGFVHSVSLLKGTAETAPSEFELVGA
jgi:hypothetical protein